MKAIKMALPRPLRLVGVALLILALAALPAQASVRLAYFGAAPGPASGQITVSWQTETELGVVAFRVVRSTQPLVQTASLVHQTQAVGSGSSGAWYDFVDTSVVAGQRYYYWLYEVTAAGEVYLISQAATAVAPTQSPLTPRAWLPLAPHFN